MSAAAPAADSIHAPLLSAWAQDWGPQRRARVLDLGAACGGNLEFFQSRAASLGIEDVLASLPEAGPEQALQLLPEGRGDFDLVLAWDLFNYLPQTVLEPVLARLSDCLGPQGRLHAFIYNSLSQIPARPSHWIIGADTRLRRAGGWNQSRPSLRYSTWHLQRHGPRLDLERAMLLQSGIQEIMLKRLAEGERRVVGEVRSLRSERLAGAKS